MERNLIMAGRAMFRNRTSNLALVTQNVQWLLLMGSSFVVSAYLQVVRHYNATRVPGTSPRGCSSLAWAWASWCPVSPTPRAPMASP
jgi:hypothetical protein